MDRSKEHIKASYAKAIKETKSEGACCSSDKSSSSETNACCEESKTTIKSKSAKAVPSFGSTVDLVKKAKIKKGDVVVDFGSGPGHDLIDAAKIIGKKGKIIGIDLTPEMVEYATAEARKLSLENVEVHLGDIEKVPLDSNIADVVISNCVINLTIDKQAVFNEAYRILKPGGRLVDADIIAGQELPKSISQNNKLWCECVSGTLTKDGYIDAIKKAGFTDVAVNIEHSGKIPWKNEELLMHSGIITAIKPMSSI